MDSQLEYPGQILTDTELLTIQQHSLIGLGWLAQAVLGTSASLTGLACTPTSPASMSVQVGTGAIFALADLADTAYGSLGTDTTSAHQIVKQGLNLSTKTFSCPAPTTTGQSIVYLIQAEYQDYDTNPQVLQYFNSANPSVAFTGPGNTGSAQNTTRQGLCALAVKSGVAATTGSQTAPAADSGYVGLYTITVAYGATTIVSGNIAKLASAPFITNTLPQLAFPGTLANPGYMKLPGGLLIQWGSGTYSSTLVNYNFPIPFTSAIFSIVSTNNGSSNVINAAYIVSLSTFNIATNSATPLPGSWFAIGM